MVVKQEETYLESHGCVFSEQCSGLLLYGPCPLEEQGTTGHFMAKWDRYSVNKPHGSRGHWYSMARLLILTGPRRNFRTVSKKENSC